VAALGDGAWSGRVRAWLEANAAFRAYIVAELAERGPLHSRDLEDRAAMSWRSRGWMDGRNVSQMLEFLWARGEIALADREGSVRLWDLAERVLPAGVPAVPADEARRVLARRRLRSSGIARPGDVGVAAGGVEVEVEGVPGPWIADPDLLERPGGCDVIAVRASPRTAIPSQSRSTSDSLGRGALRGCRRCAASSA
jgi:hypothetical protein